MIPVNGLMVIKMKKTKMLLMIVLALCVVVMVFTFVDFLCLHDIYKDYISRSALDHLEIDIERDLPEWTSTPGEWQMVTLGYGVRFVFLIFNIAALAFCLKKLISKE
jgi:hypothetical protein